MADALESPKLPDAAIALRNARLRPPLRKKSRARAPSPLLPQTLALVPAGGRGSRLGPLTDWRAKPAVSFGGKFRIIDFALSNCVNSGARSGTRCAIGPRARRWRCAGRVSFLRRGDAADDRTRIHRDHREAGRTRCALSYSERHIRAQRRVIMSAEHAVRFKRVAEIFRRRLASTLDRVVANGPEIRYADQLAGGGRPDSMR